MFFTRANDVLSYVDCLWHVDREADDNNVLSVSLFVIFLHPAPLHAVILSADASCQRVVDVQCEPVSLCVDSLRWTHAVLQDLLCRCDRGTVKCQCDVLWIVLDAVVESLVQQSSWERVFVHSNNEV